MTDEKPDSRNRSELLRRALSRWENEGGAAPRRVKQVGPGMRNSQSNTPPLTNAELVQLHVRVIALENLLIALFAEATDRQLDLAREMAAYISPRPGFTEHPATIHAAAQMLSLVDRAVSFRGPQA